MCRNRLFRRASRASWTLWITLQVKKSPICSLPLSSFRWPINHAENIISPSFLGFIPPPRTVPVQHFVLWRNKNTIISAERWFPRDKVTNCEFSSSCLPSHNNWKYDFISADSSSPVRIYQIIIEEANRERENQCVPSSALHHLGNIRGRTTRNKQANTREIPSKTNNDNQIKK